MRNFILTSVAAIAAVTIAAPQSASASHETPLYLAACEYREQARNFQRAVIRSPYQDHYAERMADRLGDAASRLAGLVHRLDHPDRIERALAEWNQVQYLQPRLEGIIFANPACPSRPDLWPCWERVTCAYTELERLMQPVCVHPVARPVIPPVAIVPRPSTCNTIPSYRVPVAPLPSYRVPVTPTVPSYRVPTAPIPNYRNPIAPRPAPEVIPAVPQTNPTHWRSRNSWSPRVEPTPYWNASRSRATNPRQHPMYSYQGMNAVQLAALIARLVD